MNEPLSDSHDLIALLRIPEPVHLSQFSAALRSCCSLPARSAGPGLAWWCLSSLKATPALIAAICPCMKVPYCGNAGHPTAAPNHRPPGRPALQRPYIPSSSGHLSLLAHSLAGKTRKGTTETSRVHGAEDMFCSSRILHVKQARDEKKNGASHLHDGRAFTFENSNCKT